MARTGRPKEGLDTLPKEWYSEVIELYKEGGSDSEVWALIWGWRGSFSDDLWKRWMEEEPEFSGTIKGGRKLAAAWWEENGRTNLKSKEFNYTGWYMQMKNRFGWADSTKTDITSKGESINTLTAEQAREQAKKLDDDY